MNLNTCCVCLKESSDSSTMYSLYKRGKIGDETMLLVDILNICTNLSVSIYYFYSLNIIYIVLVYTVYKMHMHIENLNMQYCSTIPQLTHGILGHR